MKGDRAFWIQSAGSEKQAEPILKILGDKWVRTAAGSDDGFSDVCDLDGLLDEFESSDPDGTTTVGAVSTVDGVEVVELSGDGDGDGDTTRKWGSGRAANRIGKDGKRVGEGKRGAVRGGRGGGRIIKKKKKRQPHG